MTGFRVVVVVDGSTMRQDPVPGWHTLQPGGQTRLHLAPNMRGGQTIHKYTTEYTRILFCCQNRQLAAFITHFHVSFQQQQTTLVTKQTSDQRQHQKRPNHGKWRLRRNLHRSAFHFRHTGRCNWLLHGYCNPSCRNSSFHRSVQKTYIYICTYLEIRK